MKENLALVLQPHDTHGRKCQKPQVSLCPVVKGA
uniref:Uncharacterized protein n=1 Tax=Anguilla anguilla TaxID=7936 RepID=A0A0E9RX51_ANGAN